MQLFDGGGRHLSAPPIWHDADQLAVLQFDSFD
jgi:hypothetical protein